MSRRSSTIAPRYVRLSGEIADQAVLDGLRATFPQAGDRSRLSLRPKPASPSTSTTASRVFRPTMSAAVRDGVEMKVVGRLAAHPLAAHCVALCRRPGDVCSTPTDLSIPATLSSGAASAITSSAARAASSISAGLKVHPEEIEAVINQHPQVGMSLVRSKQNPITGAIAVADIVLQIRAGRHWCTASRDQGRYSQILPRSAAAPQSPGRDKLRVRDRHWRCRQAGAPRAIKHGSIEAKRACHRRQPRPRPCHLSKARRLGLSGHRRGPAEEKDATAAIAHEERANKVRCISCRSISARSIRSRDSCAACARSSAARRPRQQCRARLRGRAGDDAQFADRGTGPRQHARAARSHQIRGARR